MIIATLVADRVGLPVGVFVFAFFYLYTFRHAQPDSPRYSYWISVKSELFARPTFMGLRSFFPNLKQVLPTLSLSKLKKKKGSQDDDGFDEESMRFSFYEKERDQVEEARKRGIKAIPITVEDFKTYRAKLLAYKDKKSRKLQEVLLLFTPQEAWFFIVANAAVAASFIPQRFPAVSFFFYYQTLKALTAGKRDEGYLGNPYPATALGTNNKEVRFSSYLVKGAAIALIFTVIIYVSVEALGKLTVSKSTISILSNINIHLAPYYHYQMNYILLGAAFFYLFLFISYCFYVKALEVAQRSPWMAQQDIYQGWIRHFNDLKVNPVPAYIREDEFPMKSPLFKLTYFQLATGTNYYFLESKENDLVASLGSTMAMVMPYPMQDASTGQAIPASVNPMLMVVAQATSHLGDSPHTDISLDRQTLSFAIQYAFRRAFRGLAIPNLTWVGDKSMKVLYPQKSNIPLQEQVAKLKNLGFDFEFNVGGDANKEKEVDPNAYLVETVWALPNSLNFDDLAKRVDSLKEKLGVKWLGIGKRDGSNYVSIVYGYNPISLPLKDGPDKQFMERLEWERILRVSRLLGENGRIPEYLGSQSLRAGLTSYSFSLVEGLTETKIRSSQESLTSVMQKNFLDIEIGIKDFRVIIGDSNPMEEIKLFINYDSSLIFPPKDSPDITFYVGVGLDGDLIKFAHDSELAHLLIGGSSGMGKSTLIHSMLVQLAAKNLPSQWELRIAEPKNEMQRYLSLPHLKRFIDQETNPANPYKPMANMFKELVAEMEGRYALFGRLPNRPQNLAQARAIEEAKHMHLPYITCMVEECSDYFVKPTLKRYMEDWEQILFYAGMLIRKARAAGIYLVFATQKPVNDSLPTSIKDNCRRIGFGTSSLTASQVIIGETGLEKIKVRGQGMVSSINGYRSFKSFYFREKKEGVEGSSNEIEIYLEKLCTEPANRAVPALARPSVFDYVDEQMIMSRLEA